jgi:hypothetical protein
MKRLRACRIMRVKILSAALLCSAAAAAPSVSAGEAPQGRLAFVTYLHSESQEQAAAMLADSIRRWGGAYANSPVYAVLTDAARTGSRLAGKNVDLVSLSLAEPARSFPYAAKAYAAAKVEEMTSGTVDTLVWLDPETLLLGPPAAYDLSAGAAAAVAPVSLVNIGQPPDEPVDDFWRAVYKRCGLDTADIYTVETFVDEKTVRVWLNCGMFSVRPERGLLREWAGILDEFLHDTEFLRTCVADAPHRIFLHQAVISTLIAAKLKRPEIRWLPKGYNYPLFCHGLGFPGAAGTVHLIPDRKKVKSLDELTSVFLESLIVAHADWIEHIPPGGGPLRDWMIREVRKIYEK